MNYGFFVKCEEILGTGPSSKSFKNTTNPISTKNILNACNIHQQFWLQGI